MKRAKLSNKLIVFIVLITMAIFTMGASSWLIITENPASPSWGQQEVTASISVTGTAYEGETGLILKSNVPGKLVYNNTTLATVSSSQLNTNISITKAPTNLSGAITNNTLSASVTFEPNATWLLSHKILNETALSLSANVRAVMWDGSSTGYSSVNKALTTATSGTIYVLESFDTYCTFKGTTKTDDTLLAYKQLTQLTITGNHTIPANLVLAIPYSGTNDSYGYVASETVADRIRNAFAEPLTYLKYHLTLGQSATLTVNGKLNLGGMIGGGNGGYAPASLTAADYGQLTVKSSALITNNNEINSYGLIIEDSENNGSEIINNKKITYPFTIVEHRGGSAFVDLGGGYMAALGNNLQYNVAPFNRFYMANITPKMTTSSAGTLMGFLDLYINNTDNPISLSLLGSGSSFFINLGTGSKFVNKYSVSKKIHDWDFYGNLSFNSLNMKLPTPLGARDLSTKNALFPISWHFNVAFHTLSNSSTATIKSTQDIKVMPGSSFHIDKGVTMEVGKIVAYGADFLTDTAHNQPTGTLAKYENGNTEFSHGRLVVDGNLVANSVGGYITSNNNGAKLVISSANTVETREVTGSDSVAWSITANGDIYNTSDTALQVGTYYSIATGEAAYKWLGAGSNVTINYVVDSNNLVEGESHTNPAVFNGSQIALNSATSTSEAYSFTGWYFNLGDSYSVDLINFQNVAQNLDLETASITLYGKWENVTIYTVTINKGSGNNIDLISSKSISEGKNYNPYEDSSLENVKAGDASSDTHQYVFEGWYVGETRIPEATGITVTDNITIKAQWIKKNEIIVTPNNSTVTITADNIDFTASTIYVPDGTEITVSATSKANYEITGATINDTGMTIADDGQSCSGSATITSDTNKIVITTQKTGGSSPCVTEGTLVTLADGTQKPVEQLTYADEILVFNHETGKIEKGNIATLDHLDFERAWYDVINLKFSNGNILRTVWNHGLYNVTLNRYVFIHEGNYKDYIGDEFYSVKYVNGEFVNEIVKLTESYITNEFIKVYNPTTAVHMNYFASGMLNVTALPNEYLDCWHVNIFEYDENMKIDEEKKQADIEKYGLYTYEDFKEYLTEEQFNVLPFNYLKVAVGKGRLTWEDIIDLINYFKDNGLM